MRKLLLGAATVITSLGLTAGVAAAQTGGGNISDTGPDSSASIRTKVRMNTHLSNRNNLTVTNNSSQSASSGEAEVEHNTRGGDATSGDAKNANAFTLSATVNNNTAGILGSVPTPSGGVGGGSISDTGPDSDARIRTSVSTSTSVYNTNNLTVTNSSSQSAYTGDAKVSQNTRGGDATSGNASNTNTSSITLNVSN